MEIRLYRKQDAQGVKNLILGILAEEYPFDRSAYSDSDINDISGVYGSNQDAFFVLDDEQTVIGTVGVKHEGDDSVLLRRLYLDKRYRQKGYGSRLINTAIDFCKKKKYKYMIFRATGRMTDAINLCKKRGFETTEELDMGGFTIHKLVLELH